MRTTDSKHSHPVAPNVVARDFLLPGPNFSSLKMEVVHIRSFRTREEAKLALFEYMEVFYNRRRRHSSLGYGSPAEYERTAEVQRQAA